MVPTLLLTAADAAKALAISPRTLWTLTDNGEIPVVHVTPRSIRYDPRDLLAWIDRRKATAAAGKERADDRADQHASGNATEGNGDA